MLNLKDELKQIENLSNFTKSCLDKIEGNISNIDADKKHLVISSFNEIRSALKDKKDIKEVINNIQKNADSI